MIYLMKMKKSRPKNKLSRRKAQTFLEYTFVAILTTIVLAVMFNYINYGFQGKLKESADSLSEEQFTNSGSRSMVKSTIVFSYEGGQYEPTIVTTISNRRDDRNFESFGKEKW